MARSRTQIAKPKRSKKRRAIAASVQQTDDMLRQPAEMYAAQSGWIALMGKNAAAFAQLQIRLTRCRTPFELWSEQMKFIQGRIEDANEVVRRMSS